jgi:hypothetical protein
MTDHLKIKESKVEYTDDKGSAHNITKDPGVKGQNVSGEVKNGAQKPVSDDSPIEPHTMDNDVTKSMFLVKLSCPVCGESTLHAEFPDQYEAWIKCPCGFFMGMSNQDWHRMENSHNINEKIKKMAIKRGILKVQT